MVTVPWLLSCLCQMVQLPLLAPMNWIHMRRGFRRLLRLHVCAEKAIGALRNSDSGHPAFQIKMAMTSPCRAAAGNPWASGNLACANSQLLVAPSVPAGKPGGSHEGAKGYLLADPLWHQRCSSVLALECFGHSDARQQDSASPCVALSCPYWCCGSLRAQETVSMHIEHRCPMPVALILMGELSQR